jgi:polar amino acid transport system substrate-binding protein
MKNVLLMIFTFVTALSFNVSSLMAQELLLVRVDANYAPYEMVVNGKLTGLHVDLVYAVADRLGIEVKFKSVPWASAINMVQKGSVDAITYVGKTPEREEFLYYNDDNILSSSAYGFIIQKDRAGEISFNGDLQTLAAYKIGIQKGYSYGTQFDQADYLKKHEVKKADQILSLLAAKRIDLAVIDEPEYLQNRNNAKWSDITFLKPDITQRDFYIGFSKAKKLEDITNKFAKEMAAFKQTDEYQKILTKYKLN